MKFCDLTKGAYSSSTVNITLSTPATDPGTYTLELPEGSWGMGNESDYYDGPDATITYIIGGSSSEESDVTLKVTPPSGDYTEPITSIAVASGSADYPTADILSIEDIKVYLDGTEFCGLRRNYAASGIELILKETMTESGEYKVVFPAGSWSVGDYSNEDYPDEVDGGEFTVVYNMDLGGVKYNIEIPETKLTPNSVDADDPTLVDPYDLAGEELTEFRLNNVSGELYAAEGATVHIYNKRAKYDVEAPVTADAPKKSLFSDDMTTTVHFTLPEPIKYDGTYTLEIPKGIIGDADFKANPETCNANRAYTWTVTFTGGQPEPDASVQYDLNIISAKPAEGKVDMDAFVWEVTNFDISSDYDLAPDSKAEASLVCETAGYSKSGVIRNVSASAFVRTLKFTNSTEPSKTGTYILTIPAGTFGDADWRQDPETGHTNPEIKVYYLVSASGTVTTVYDLEVASVTPSNGATVSVADDAPVVISFTAAGEVGYYPHMKVAVVCEAAEYNSSAVITAAETADDVTTFTLTLDTPITVNGEYTLSFPEGLFGDAEYITNWSTGHGSKAYTSSFNVTGGADQPEPAKYDLSYTVTPNNGAYLPLNEKVYVTFVFPEGTLPTNDSPRATMKSTEANYFLTVLFQKGATDGTYTLNYATAPKKEGTYNINIPEGLFYNETLNSYSPAIDIAYIVADTAVDSILNDEAAQSGVYNLNGVYVGNDLNALPAGIYVMKNRKVVIKK